MSWTIWTLIFRDRAANERNRGESKSLGFRRFRIDSPNDHTVDCRIPYGRSYNGKSDGAFEASVKTKWRQEAEDRIPECGLLSPID